MRGAANAEYLSGHPGRSPSRKAGAFSRGSDEALESKLAGMDPEKVARVKAAMAAKAKKAAEEDAARIEAGASCERG